MLAARLRAAARPLARRQGQGACSAKRSSSDLVAPPPEQGRPALASTLAALPPDQGRTASASSSAPPGTSAGGARSAYTTLAAPAALTLEVKKSKFITTAWPVTSAEEGLALIAGCSDGSASHNCWALVCGPAARASDDGEPAGTAGRPILAAIQAEGLDGVAVIVTRLFGGTKLGAGGLARAYGAAARDCLRGAARVCVKPATTVCVRVATADVGVAYECLAGAGARVVGEAAYEQGGEVVVLRASLPQGEVDALADALASRTGGRARCEVEEEEEEGGMRK